MEKNNLLKILVSRLDKLENTYSKIQKEINIFDETGTGFVKNMTAEDLEKIDIEFIVVTLPRLIQASDAQDKFDRLISKIAPAPLDDIDFI